MSLNIIGKYFTIKLILCICSLVLFLSFTDSSGNVVSDGFDFPIGNKTNVTPQKDGDGWYNANSFGNKFHLGDDWNAESGGNSDCGLKVFASSNGKVIYKQNAGSGWGNVIIIRHQLLDGSYVESLYGHLSKMEVELNSIVERGQLIGRIGDGRNPCGDSKPYYAHLHFEIRYPNCPAWGEAGPGYSANTKGWVDPYHYILLHRKF